MGCLACMGPTGRVGKRRAQAVRFSLVAAHEGLSELPSLPGKHGRVLADFKASEDLRKIDAWVRIKFNLTLKIRTWSRLRSGSNFGNKWINHMELREVRG